MKKYILRIFLIEIIVLIIYSGRCHANSINSINMDIDIDKYGNGYITEEWDVTLDNGTEGYRVISTKNEFSSYDISSFYVEKDNRRYEYLDTWDTEANFQQKSYKCGIIEKDQSIELCWGISEYGKNKYVLRYKVKNFVTQYKDNQGIYYDLLNIKQTVNNVKVKIHSDICKLSLNNSRIWAFGYDGSINFNDEGEIVLDSEGILNSNQKMVTLIRFQKDIFDINGKSYYTFDNVYESAIKSVKLSESQIFIKKIFGILKYFGYIFILLIPFIIIIKIRKLSVNCEKEIYEEGKELPLDSEIEYYRDIPCNGDFDRIYWIAHKYEIVKESQLKRGLIGAILLKKIKENVITVTKNKNGFLNLSDNNYSIDLSNITVSENNSEKHVIYALKKAAGDNLILEPNEFERLCKKYYYYITRIFEKLESSESDKLSSEKYIEKITINETKLFKTNKINKTVYKRSLRDEAIKIKGFIKFLKNYSLINEREYIEVKQWEEYLIIAHLLGVADNVEQQFKKLNPEIDSYGDTDIIGIGREIQKTISKGIEKVEYEIEKDRRRNNHIKFREYNSTKTSKYDYSGNDRDSGGGGSSYDSGGDSASNKSGGGFR